MKNKISNSINRNSISKIVLINIKNSINNILIETVLEYIKNSVSNWAN